MKICQVWWYKKPAKKMAGGESWGLYEIIYEYI